MWERESRETRKKSQKSRSSGRVIEWEDHNQLCSSSFQGQKKSTLQEGLNNVKTPSFCIIISPANTGLLIACSTAQQAWQTAQKVKRLVFHCASADEENPQTGFLKKQAVIWHRLGNCSLPPCELTLTGLSRYQAGMECGRQWLCARCETSAWPGTSKLLYLLVRRKTSAITAAATPA